MRIIAGEFRGRKLLAPDGEVTRPVTDRVKQSLFDILAPGLPDARVYDCFAGTGSMGLECLSRGAARVVFFEKDRSAVARLKQNIGALGLEQSSQVIASDIFAYFSRNTQPPADLVFFDPPYRFVVEEPGKLQSFSEHLAEHLSEDAIVVFRHDSRDRLELPKLVQYDERSYGGMTLEFLRLGR